MTAEVGCSRLTAALVRVYSICRSPLCSTPFGCIPDYHQSIETLPPRWSGSPSTTVDWGWWRTSLGPRAHSYFAISIANGQQVLDFVDQDPVCLLQSHVLRSVHVHVSLKEGNIVPVETLQLPRVVLTVPLQLHSHFRQVCVHVSESTMQEESMNDPCFSSVILSIQP